MVTMSEVTMSDISFVFFAVAWGAAFGLYINHTNLHEKRFKIWMIAVLIISLFGTLLTY